MREMYNYYELFKNIDPNPSYIYDYFISSNSDYFYNFNIIKNHCDSYINSLKKCFIDSFEVSENVIFEIFPEFKLYHIISENLRLAEKFLHEIDNFYLYKLEFSSFRFYLRQSIEAFLHLFNIMEENLIYGTLSSETYYYMLCKIYSAKYETEEIKGFRKELISSDFYSKDKVQKKIIFEEYNNKLKGYKCNRSNKDKNYNRKNSKNNNYDNRPTSISVSSSFYIAKKSLNDKFSNFRKDCFGYRQNISQYAELHETYVDFINKLHKIYKNECKFVHVDIDNDNLFEFSLDVKKTFHNLNNRLEDLVYALYNILIYSCNLFYAQYYNGEYTIRFAKDENIDKDKYISDYDPEETLDALSEVKSYCKENNITALNVSAKIDFLKL